MGLQRACAELGCSLQVSILPMKKTCAIQFQDSQVWFRNGHTLELLNRSSISLQVGCVHFLLQWLDMTTVFSNTAW